MAAPTDRVQVIKQESAAGGGDPADADPFYTHEPIDETEDGLSAAGLFLQDQAGPADESVVFWREGGSIRVTDQTYGTTDLLDKVSPSAHKALRDLVHFVDGPADGFTSGAYQELTPSGTAFPTACTWYTSAAKTTKIIEQSVTYNANKTIATSTWALYDVDGTTVLVTLVDTFAYSGAGSAFLSSKTRTWS